MPSLPSPHPYHFHDVVRIITGYPAQQALFPPVLPVLKMLLPPGELEARRSAWKPPKLANMTPWEEIYRSMVGQLGTGACLEPATLYLNVIETRGESRNNH